jgi:hypothetical protein
MIEHRRHNLEVARAGNDSLDAGAGLRRIRGVNDGDPVAMPEAGQPIREDVAPRRGGGRSRRRGGGNRTVFGSGGGLRIRRTCDEQEYD